MSVTILIVDDSEFMRDIISQTLEVKDYTVLQAYNGKEGLDVFKSNTLDLIITDINMPEMDGITFIKEIRKINSSLPVIVLTTESVDSKKQDAMGAGANGWVVKPFSPVNFLAMIEDVLN